MTINQAKKNVLIFSTAYLPLVGGAEIAVKEITDRINNFEFDMITAKSDKKLPNFEKIGKVNIYRVGFGLKVLDKFLLPILGFLKGVKLNKERSYQIIWSIMASQAGVGAACFRIFYPAKKLLLTIQEGDPEEHLKRYVLGINFLYKIFIRPWHLLPFKRADYITVISSDLKKRARRSEAKCPIRVVPNGVDLKKFLIWPNHPKPNNFQFSNQDLRKKLGIKEDEKVVITVSRLVKKNGIDDLIKAGQYLEFPFKLLVIGTGLEEERLKELAKDLKIEDQVLFLGHIEHEELPKYSAIADVFVRPSLSEGLGSAFLEAMAAGLPIIGTPVGGIPDFLIDKETGLFCKVRDPKHLAKKIKEVLTDNQLREKIIANGQKIVQEKYNWDNIALKMERIFIKCHSERT